jgi:hypothetical protein
VAALGEIIEEQFAKFAGFQNTPLWGNRRIVMVERKITEKSEEFNRIVQIALNGYQRSK